MPTLHWIGKEKVVTHHQDVPYRVLEHKYGFRSDPASGNGQETVEPTHSGNKIIHGDNLEALKSLLPKYEGKIKCIYIDPPYNTGNESWVYNDNVNHPKIKKWLGEVVGKDGEDFTRHDKWLCMMYPRLKLLHKLLAEDGAIFISIDDNEQANLKLMCDEIFGVMNCIGPLIQNKMNAKNDTLNIQKNHEFILVYRKSNNFSNGVKTLPTLINKTINYRNVFEENGKFFYINDAITTRGEGGILNARPNLGYTVYYNPKTNHKVAISDYNIELAKESNSIKEIYSTCRDKVANGYIPIRPPKVRGKLGCWTWSLEKFNNENDNIIITGKNGSYAVKKRTFVDSSDVKSENNKLVYLDIKKSNSRSILDFSTNDGTNVLNIIMNEHSTFDNPKNINMIEYLINLLPDKNSLILDSFAGSGTTAHAVLNLNKQDGGNRKFILVEMEDYANDITAERVKRVANGYGKDKKAVEGTGGAFDYYELGLSLFKKDDNLNEEVGEEEIRNYIYYTETKSKLERPQSTEGKYLLDNYNGTGYYFYYEKEALTVLDTDTLNIVIEQQEQYIIYADVCLLDTKYLQEKNIMFKKIPRDITRF